MSLDRDDMHEIPLLCGFHDLHDLIGEHRVLAPVGWRERYVVHVLYRCECVKTEVRIYLVAVVEESSVVVQSACRVSVLFRNVRHVLKRLLAELSLIRVFARAEEFCAYPGEHLKLCVGSARSAGRDCKSPRSVFLAELVEYRRRITVDGYVRIILRYSERFHLEHDYVRMLRAVIFILKDSISSLLGLLLKNGCHHRL